MCPPSCRQAALLLPDVLTGSCRGFTLDGVKFRVVCRGNLEIGLESDTQVGIDNISFRIKTTSLLPHKCLLPRAEINEQVQGRHLVSKSRGVGGGHSENYTVNIGEMNMIWCILIPYKHEYIDDIKGKG